MEPELLKAPAPERTMRTYTWLHLWHKWNQWQVIGEGRGTIHSFQGHLLETPIKGDHYLIQQRYCVTCHTMRLRKVIVKG